MKIVNHLKMGCLIWENMSNKDVALKKWLYLLGNLAPDFSYSFTFKLHSYTLCGGRFRKLLRKLIERSGVVESAWFSFHAGIMSHYVCDFFCYAHTDAFKGKVREHMRYEKTQEVRADEMLEFNRERFTSCNYSGLVTVIEGHLTKHSQVLTKKAEMSAYDIPLAVYISTLALLAICQGSTQLSEIEPLRPPLLSA